MSSTSMQRRELIFIDLSEEKLDTFQARLNEFSYNGYQIKVTVKVEDKEFLILERVAGHFSLPDVPH